MSFQGMKTLEELERIAPGHGSVVCVSFDWRDPYNRAEWRPEWRLVLADLDRKRRHAQSVEVAAQNETALVVLKNRYYVKPDFTALVVSRALDCMQALMPGRDQFHAWVCSTIQESTHKVFREEQVWQDPKYANKDRADIESFARQRAAARIY